jgi:Sec-independent protein translocase protein TatA
VFGVSGQELLLIALVALILLGPQRIPDLARAFAKGYREFTRVRRQVDSTLGELKSDLKLDIDDFDLRAPAGRRVPLDQLHAVEGAGSSPLPEPLAVPQEDDYLAG